MGDYGAVRGFPPIARKEPGHNAVAAPAVPDQNSTRLENSRELADDFRIIARVRKESERSEEVDNSVEFRAPAAGHLPHVGLGVPEIRPDASFPRELDQMLRIVEPVDIESSLGQEVGVSSLSARNVEDSRALRKSEHIHYACNFMAITLEREDGLVLEQIPGVEVRLPPLGRFAQKKTGSR